MWRNLSSVALLVLICSFIWLYLAKRSVVELHFSDEHVGHTISKIVTNGSKPNIDLTVARQLASANLAEPSHCAPSVLSADAVTAEIQTVRAKHEASMQEGKELLRRRAGIQEWKEFCSRNGLHLIRAKVDDSSGTYYVDISSKDRLPDFVNGLLCFGFSPYSDPEAYISFYFADDLMRFDYKPYMSPKTLVGDIVR